MESVVSAFTTGVGDIVTDVTSMVTGILPVALPVLGLGIAVASDHGGDISNDVAHTAGKSGNDRLH